MIARAGFARRAGIRVRQARKTVMSCACRDNGWGAPAWGFGLMLGSVFSLGMGPPRVLACACGCGCRRGIAGRTRKGSRRTFAGPARRSCQMPGCSCPSRTGPSPPPACRTRIRTSMFWRLCSFRAPKTTISRAPSTLRGLAAGPLSPPFPCNLASGTTTRSDQESPWLPGGKRYRIRQLPGQRRRRWLRCRARICTRPGRGRQVRLLAGAEITVEQRWHRNLGQQSFNQMGADKSGAACTNTVSPQYLP